MNTIYEYVDVKVEVDSDGDITIEGDGQDYLGTAEQEKLWQAIGKNLGKQPVDGPVRASDVSFNEGLMRLAAVHDKTVEFRYAKGKGGVIETRVLKPKEVRHVGDHVTFIGYDPDRDDVRAYRVDRVKGEVRVS